LPNKELDFTKAFHGVLSHTWLISKDLQLKTEWYYQNLYNVPIEQKSSAFSMLNEGAGFDLMTNHGFENKGKGYNYGMDVTFEKSFNNSYYFLLTTSLFDSKYKGSDGVKRNTAFNSNFVMNSLVGKEFTFENGNTFGIDMKLLYSGGKRYTPIDLEQSILKKEEVLVESQTFAKQYDSFFKLDLKFSYKINRPKVSHLFELDIQNLTNEENIFTQEYNVNKEKVTTSFQRGLFPMALYRIYF